MQVQKTAISDQLIEAAFCLVANIEKVGSLAVLGFAENPNFDDEVCGKCPDITPAWLRRMESIGLRKLHPQLAISEAPGMKRLAKLPYDLQEKYLKEGVTLLLANGETLQADPRNLTPKQSRQAIGDEDVNDLSKQRLLMEDEVTKRAAQPVQPDCPYRIVGKQVVVMVACKFDLRDLTRMMARLTE